VSVTVRTQAELDAALAANEATIYIESPAGVWLQLTKSGSAHVVARGSAHVEARDSAHVVARGSAHVEAWGSAHVEARDSAHVEAWGSAHVEAWGSAHVEARDSAHVVARDSAHVEAWGSAHVVAWGSAHVEAWGSAHVEARDSAHVVARDSAHVEAWGSAHVVAWGSAHVVASPYVAVHLHSQRVTLKGGVVIDMTKVNERDSQHWCDLHGVRVTRGRARLFKAVDADLFAGHSYRKTQYPIGKTVTCPDWQPNNSCGHGLHVSPSVTQAFDHYRQAARFLEVSVKLADIHPIDGWKCKVPALRVVREVDRWGTPL
jgi:hypothetical protein